MKSQSVKCYDSKNDSSLKQNEKQMLVWSHDCCVSFHSSLRVLRVLISDPVTLLTL